MSTLFKEYTAHCDECDIEMTHRSKDGTQIFCTNCWVPKVVPLEYLGSNQRLRVKNDRIKLQTERTV